MCFNRELCEIRFTPSIFSDPPKIPYAQRMAFGLIQPLIPFNAFLILESRETKFKANHISGYPNLKLLFQPIIV